MDNEANTARGAVPGAVAAAVRKLHHELGIPLSQLTSADFRFLTRLHYCAADVDVRGGRTGWGEHEMDYILFVKADVSLSPHADEIQATCYVGPAELKRMMRPDSGLQWSPWFRIIADNFLFRWWADLDAVLTAQAHADWSTIHKLDCKVEE